jgi:DNA-binding PadR family transcriptional regulator
METLTMNEILVLYILKRHDLTMYSINKAIEEFFYPYFKPSVGSISPVLDKLQKEGCVEFSEKFSKGGLLSKTFRILPMGLRELTKLILEFNFSKNIQAIREISALLLCSDVLNNNEKQILKDKIKLELNILNKKTQDVIGNPYLGLAENQKKIYNLTKTEIERTLALVEEIL